MKTLIMIYDHHLYPDQFGLLHHPNILCVKPMTLLPAVLERGQHNQQRLLPSECVPSSLWRATRNHTRLLYRVHLQAAASKVLENIHQFSA